MSRLDDATLPEALALNNAHAVELSFQTPAAFRALVAQAFFARWSAGREAFLLAFEQGASYQGENFRWFRQRYPRFVYVDRVVVRPEARRRGAARALYEELFAAARAAGHTLVTCEVNVEPPNPASDRLHEALGFVEVGRARLATSAKVVRYLARPLESR